MKFLNWERFIQEEMLLIKIDSIMDEGKELPFNIQDQTIFYVGPTPSKPGQVFGSGGPTTSGRMDAYSPRLIKLGLCDDW